MHDCDVAWFGERIAALGVAVLRFRRWPWLRRRLFFEAIRDVKRRAETKNEEKCENGDAVKKKGGHSAGRMKKRLGSARRCSAVHGARVATLGRFHVTFYWCTGVLGFCLFRRETGRGRQQRNSRTLLPAGRACSLFVPSFFFFSLLLRVSPFPGEARHPFDVAGGRRRRVLWGVQQKRRSRETRKTACRQENGKAATAAGVVERPGCTDTPTVVPPCPPRPTPQAVAFTSQCLEPVFAHHPSGSYITHVVCLSVCPALFSVVKCLGAFVYTAPFSSAISPSYASQFVDTFPSVFVCARLSSGPPPSPHHAILNVIFVKDFRLLNNNPSVNK